MAQNKEKLSFDICVPNLANRTGNLTGSKGENP